MKIILDRSKEKARWLVWAIEKYEAEPDEHRLNRLIEYAKDVNRLTEEIIA